MSDTQQTKNTVLGEMLNRINKTNAVRTGYGKSSLPINVDEKTLSAAESWDYANNKQGVPPTNTANVASTPEVSTPTNPFNINQDLYTRYRAAGLTDDSIGRIHGATTETPFTDIFKNTTPEPEPLNEAKVKASRNVANLGEGIKVLGDMFAVGQGARIGKRNSGDIVQAQQSKEDLERNKYLTKLEGLKAGERQAAEKDWMLAFQDREKRAGEVSDYLKEMRAREDADKRFNKQLELKEAENKRDDYWKGKAYDYKDAENKREDYWKGKEYGLKVRALSNSEAKASKGSKGKDSKGNTEVLINGKKMLISNAIIKDVAGRARSNENLSAEDKSIYNGMNDEAIFNKEKSQYIKVIDGGKIVITNTPGEWGNESNNKTKETVDNDPAGIL